jgi:acetylornithine deacetylase
MSEWHSRALLERLVGFATVSRESNLALIGFIRDYLPATACPASCS